MTHRRYFSVFFLFFNILLKAPGPVKAAICALWKRYPCFYAQSLLLNFNVFIHFTSSSSQKYRPIFFFFFLGRSDSSNPITFCHTPQNLRRRHSRAQTRGQPPSLLCWLAEQHERSDAITALSTRTPTHLAKLTRRLLLGVTQPRTCCISSPTVPWKFVEEAEQQKASFFF